MKSDGEAMNNKASLPLKGLGKKGGKIKTKKLKDSARRSAAKSMKRAY